MESCFIKNEAKYHESCRLMFNNTKLQRVQKRHQPPDTSDKESRIIFDIVTNNQKQKYEKQVDKNN
jgi:hypothetical protein